MDRGKPCVEPWPKPSAGGWHYLRIEEKKKNLVIKGFAWTSIDGFDLIKEPGDEEMLVIFTTTHEIIIEGLGLDYIVEELSHQRLKLLRVGRCEEGSRRMHISIISVYTNEEMAEARRKSDTGEGQSLTS